VFIFTILVFTHVFIPAIFLIYLALYTYRKREFEAIFFLLTCIYLSVLISYTTYYFPIIIETLRNSIFSFGRGGYSVEITRSFREAEGILNQLISNLNRIRMPLTWIIVGLGSLLLFLQKKLNAETILLGLTASIYLAVGALFPILGMRALQVLLIPLLIGIFYYYSKWKNPTIAVVLILAIIAVSGPMRTIYDQTQFQLDEETEVCEFLADHIHELSAANIAVGQVNWGYFVSIYKYYHGVNPTAIRPGNPEFYELFMNSIEKNEYVIFNTNLGKEIMFHNEKEISSNAIKYQYLQNNKIYESGSTFIITGK
jgi:hypothetical protein